MKNTKFIALLFLLSLPLKNGFGQALNEYVVLAIQNNPGLKAKQFQYEASLERIAQVKGLTDPTVSVSAFGQMVETRVGQQMANLSIEQTFPWFGTLKARGDMEALTAQAQFEEYQEAKNALAFEVKAAYYPLFEVDTLLDLNLRNEVLANSIKSMATIQFQQGKSPMVNVLQTQILIEQIKTDVSLLKRKRKALEVSFNTLLNRDNNLPITTIPSLALPDESLLSLDSLHGNPRVKKWSYMHEASVAQARVASKEGMPMIGVGFTYIAVSKRPDVDFSDNGKDAYMPMVSLSLPIYRNKYTAKRKEAQFMQASYEAMAHEEQNELMTAYTMTRYELEEAVARYHLYHHHIMLVNQSIELTLTGIESGTQNITDVLDLHTTRLMHESEMVRALVASNIALAKLQYIMGN